MSCEACETAQSHCDVVFPVRVGKYDIGYGNVLLIGCPAHVQIAIDKIRSVTDDHPHVPAKNPVHTCVCEERGYSGALIAMSRDNAR